MKMVLASQNEKKLEELRQLLSDLQIDVLFQSEIGIAVEPEETGTTLEENARLKAEAVMLASGMPAIADDSGLEVDSLGGGPGVYSARYGGPGLDDQGRYRLLLQNMSGQINRKCRFVSVIACAFPNGQVLTARGKCEGIVAFAPVGENGFGYDPIFYIPALRKTMAQLTAQEKNEISHRGNALRAFQKTLWDHISNQNR